jgi:phosphoglycolate phosphatase
LGLVAARAFLFDLDGTLWDSHPWFARLIAEAGGPPETEALAALRTLRPAATMLTDAGVSQAGFRRLCRRAGPELYSDVDDVLSELAKRNVPMGAVTNLPRWLADPMLECLGLAERLDSLVHFGRTKRRKPHPEPILLGLDDLDIEPGPDVFYVGDSATDCRAAIGAGASFAWASWGYSNDQPEGSTRSLSGMREVLDL